jgi:hypothetical protein
MLSFFRFFAFLTGTAYPRKAFFRQKIRKLTQSISNTLQCEAIKKSPAGGLMSTAISMNTAIPR